MILAAGGGDTPPAHHALEQLCRTYWLPLYCYVRRRGFPPEDAQDLTQEFFARLLARDGLRNVSPARGKFRSFMLACMNHLLSDEWDRASRQKRGGGQPVISFDARLAEERYGAEPADQRTPEAIFERRWAHVLLEEALRRLEQEYAEAGKPELYSTLKDSLIDHKIDWNYRAVAQTLGMAEGAVRMAAHRLRQRFGELFRSTVADTLTEKDDLAAEMQYLSGVLRS